MNRKSLVAIAVFALLGIVALWPRVLRLGPLHEAGRGAEATGSVQP